MFARKVAYNIIIVMSFHFVFDEGTILITDQYKKVKIRYRENDDDGNCAILCISNQQSKIIIIIM